VNWVRSVAQFAHSLTLQNDEIPVRLAQNVSHDSEPEVRLRCLRVLFARYPQHEAAQSALKVALGDSTPAVRLAAATLLDDIPTFLALAAHDRDPSLRAEVIEKLREQIGALLWPALDTALEHDDPALLVAALRAAVATQHVAAFTRIAHLVRSSHPGVAKAAVQTLCTLDPSAAESVLLELLRDQDLSRASIAMDALGRIGTVAAIETLLRYTSSWRLGGDTRAAIRHIQSRLSNVEAGRITLLQALPGGALCLADNR
jgi:HEAT repeat protein